MKQRHFFWIPCICLIAFFLHLAAFAEEVTPIYLYRIEQDPAIPRRLYVCWTQDCGQFTIKLLQQPVLTKSSEYIVADNETMYLVLRVAITNNSNESTGWLMPNSFTVQDTYNGKIYGTYKLDVPVSAKTAEGFKQQVFYSEILPKGMLYTTLVFEVYPDVKSWIFTFAPQIYGDAEPVDTVRFQLPYPIRQYGSEE